ncbi:MAG: hypothetical protein Q9169_004814 [Polycauliona sp. 2 TL-2023]
MRLSSVAASFLLLLPLASTEALPALDPCWRSCFTPKLACKDNDWLCKLLQQVPYSPSVLTASGFCRKARQSSLLADTVTCIRQSCTGNRPFNPTALLTPFTEHCRKPIPPKVLANVNALAAQEEALPDDPNNPPILNEGAGDGTPVIKLAAAATSAQANTMTTTYIGIATDANGQQQTFAVPALVGPSPTIYGSPVTEIEGTATPTSIVTLPWPTLPVGYFFPTSRAGVVSNQPQSATTSLPPNVGVMTQTTSVPVGTPAATRGDGEEGGTLLESNVGTRRGAKSSLGLMVLLLVGIMWF